MARSTTHCFFIVNVMGSNCVAVRDVQQTVHFCLLACTSLQKLRVLKIELIKDLGGSGLDRVCHHIASYPAVEHADSDPPRSAESWNKLQHTLVDGVRIAAPKRREWYEGDVWVV